jgi:hypothetical protein
VNFSKHPPDTSATSLQGRLRWAEAIRGELTIVRAREDGGDRWTIGEHTSGSQVKKLHLVVKPEEGEPEPPEGTTLAFEGEAWIENEQATVLIFR